jgi:hypothetical protein
MTLFFVRRCNYVLNHVVRAGNEPLCCRKISFFLLGQIAAQNIRYKIKENSLCSMHTVYPIGSDPRSKVFVSKGSVNWMRAAFCFNGLYMEPSWNFAPFVNIFSAQSEQ